MCLELREIDVGVSQIISEVMEMLDFLGNEMVATQAENSGRQCHKVLHLLSVSRKQSKASYRSSEG